MTTIKTDPDTSATGFFLALLFVGLICLCGGLYNSTNGLTAEDIGPCFMEKLYCGETSWAVLLYKQNPTLVDGIGACILHKENAQYSIARDRRALMKDGQGDHYAQTVHVSDL